MQNIEKLPILKSAWASHKQFFNIFFSLKGFFLFLLPTLMVVIGLQAVRQMASSWYNSSYMLGEGTLLPMLTVFFFVFLYMMFNAFIAVKWHRMMVLDEMVSLKPCKGQWLSLKFLWKTVKLGAVAFVLFMPLVALIAVVLHNFQGQDVWLTLLLMPLVVLFILALMMFWGMTLSLPATAVGVSLKIKDALKLSKGIRLRLFGTSFVAGIPVVVVMAILGFICFYLLFSMMTGIYPLPAFWSFTALIVGVTLFLFSSLWVMFVGVGVLSIFYMHYILPQLSTLKAQALEEDVDLSSKNG